MDEQVKLRLTVLGLFVDDGDVLLIHQVTDPEPDCWDLPGGGLEPDEPLLEGLAREVREETGIRQFRVEQLLTVAESFFPQQSRLLHTVNIIYRCAATPRPTELFSDEPEIGPKGIQWLPVASLAREDCSTRAWAALEAAGLV
jgi:8-oxo-dGTP diphosphatase